MSESTKAIASLKKAANYTKLAMHKDGPRSFKKGQGALVKVIYKFGEGSISKDEAKKILGWRGRDVRFVAKKAANNGYLTIENAAEGFQMTLTELGTDIVKKRLAAEDKAADEVLGSLTDAEKAQLMELCDKISTKAQEMGIDYSKIQKKRGKRCCADKHHGKGHKHGCPEQGHGAELEHGHHHGAPKYVFVFNEGGEHGHGCDEGHAHEHCHADGTKHEHWHKHEGGHDHKHGGHDKCEKH